VETSEAIDRLTRDPATTGILVDFDGTLSAIVDRPQDAAPVSGAELALRDLAQRYALVGVVSGRSLEDLRARLDVPGVRLLGSYGRERAGSPMRRRTEGWESVAIAAAAALEELPGVVLERKGAGVALHYRLAPGMQDAVRQAAEMLAAEFGLQILPGRLVVELVAPGPGKGDAILDLIEHEALRCVLYAGDDIADLEAFRVLRSADVDAVLVAVASDEAPDALAEEADLVVNGPLQLVGLLDEIRRRTS
jgi:trehalose 6-phosphate phosphatase